MRTYIPSPAFLNQLINFLLASVKKVVYSLARYQFKDRGMIMAKNLVIVESPAKVKTIKKFLGSNYEVTASNGHVRDLPKRVSWASM